MTDRVRIDVIAAPELFAEIEAEATRMDRSLSWVVQRCLRAALPALAQIAPGSPDANALATGVLRNPIRLESLRVNLALAESGDADLEELAAIPKGTVKQMLFLPSDLYERFDGEGDRLKLASEEIIAFAWRAHADEIRELPSVNEE